MKAPPDEELRRYRTEYLRLKTALFDRATGLPAFPVLFDPLRELLDRHRQIGLVHVEAVNLGLVESLYGWQLLDGVLGRMASVLREGVGRELPDDTLLALDAVAGQHFLAFVPTAHDGGEVDTALLAAAGAALCARLDAAFSTPEFAGMGPQLAFRASHARLADSPFHRFERCIYAAIAEARAFHLERERRRERSWSEELQRIIYERAVDTVFQPVVELGSRAVLGHEAFVRGPRDTLFEAPRAMFALSSRVGLAGDLDRVCRDAALRASALVAERGKVFLNVLPAGSADWPPEPLLDPHQLVLEFSERDAPADTRAFFAAMLRCKQRGFGLALDDVGTGELDGAVLEQLRPDYLKLDGSLVRAVHTNLLQLEVLRSIVRLAEQIGAEVIAENVESEQEVEALLDAGARYGQGYLFAPPAAAPEVRQAAAPRPRKREH
ncbi:MAG TPA: EAL domain-containing protein [Candidatus Polarisedimenticolaceae bacterium]|nr:EAL domain-containing protein [Candidatus Polarisedimenticolaceae bacterium]